MTGAGTQGKAYLQWYSAYAIFHLHYKVINTRPPEFLSFSCLFWTTVFSLTSFHASFISPHVPFPQTMIDWHSGGIEAFHVISSYLNFVTVEVCTVTVGPQVALALTSTRCTGFFLLKKNPEKISPELHKSFLLRLNTSKFSQGTHWSKIANMTLTGKVMKKARTKTTHLLFKENRQ